MAFEWTPSLSVNEATIDEQHKNLIKQINDLARVAKEDSESGIKKTIQFMDKYINEHFSYEEKYMKEHKYPRLDQHKEIHKQFIHMYNDYKEDLKKKGSSLELLLKIHLYLGDWWINHIAKIDHDYYVFISKSK